MRKRITSFICVIAIALGITTECAWAMETPPTYLEESTTEAVEEQKTTGIIESESILDSFETQPSESLPNILESQETEATVEIEIEETDEVQENNPMLASDTIETRDMYRLYNPNSGEHFYTSNLNERDHLVSVGWNYEGVSWRAPITGDPVYRLYNPNAGDHHYTLNVNERDHLVSVGWNYEGIGWYSDSNRVVPIFRVYNPNAVTGTHHYTANYFEIEHLVGVGWNYEGIGWYSCDITGIESGNPGDSGENTTQEYIEISNLQEYSGTFDVNVHLYRDSSAIHKVYIPVWINADQSDIQWYVADRQSDGSYKFTVDAVNHQWKSGKYQVHCYVQNPQGEMRFIDSTTVNMNLGVKITTKALDDYSARVTIYGVDAGIKKVYFPAWSVINDQDDVVWYEGSKNSDASWSVDIHTKKHLDSGEFICDVYSDVNGVMNNLGRVEFSISEKWEGRYIDPNKPMVALTFDDGPSTYTPRILDCLEEYEQAATFFVVGYNAARYGSTMKRMLELECEIGNHSYNHPDLTTLSYNGIVNEMASVNTHIYAATGTYATVSRTPGGSYNSTVKSAISTPIIMWSIDTLDWKTRDTWSTVNCVLNNIEDGDIVLMHDIHSPTIAAAEIIIPRLVERGYQLVTVSELAQYRGNGMKAGNVYFSFK